MTVSTTYAPDTYSANGVLDTFAITFNFLSDGNNIKVSLKNTSTDVITEQTGSGTDYTVTGSNVVFNTAPASGNTVIIELNPDYKQESDYTENSNFPAETLESDLDQLKLEVQLTKDLTDRAVKVDSAVDISTFDATLPTPAADKYIGFSSDALSLVTKTIVELGTLELPVSVANGGTGATSAGAAATALGLGTADSPTHADLTLTGDLNLADTKAIKDGNDNEWVIFSETASAVNELTITNAATGNAPTITSTGGDTNIGLTIDAKGTGTITLGSADATVAIASTMTVIDEIQHAGDTNNKIGFTTDTQTFTTGGSTRMDITDSGVQLGGSGARVTTVLDEDTLSSDSATALATQQSIKAYVDAQTVTLDWELISSATASSSATIEFTDLSSTYIAYKVIIADMTVQTNTTNLYMRISDDNGSTWEAGAGDYAWIQDEVWTGGAGFTGGSNSATFMQVAGASGEEIGNAANEGCAGEVIIYNPSSSSEFTRVSFQFAWTEPDGNFTINNGGGQSKATAAVDGIQFLMSSGNIVSGTFHLFGLRAS